MISSNAVSNIIRSKVSPMLSLRKKLKSADSEIKNYVDELKKANLKLQKQVARLQADNTTKDNRIKALEEHPITRKVRLTFGKKGAE